MDKCSWKMKWCKEQGVPPADNYWWDEAELAYQNQTRGDEDE